MIDRRSSIGSALRNRQRGFIINPFRFGGGGGGGGSGYDDEVLADTPLAYWKLDESSGGNGTSIADSSGNANNCAVAFSSGSADLANVTVAPISGLSGIGNAIDQTKALTGGGTVAIRDSTPSATLRLTTGAFSFEFWWLRKGAGFEWFLFNGLSNGATNNYWEIRQESGGSTFTVKGTGASGISITHGISDSNPHHVVLVVNAARNSIAYYRDGSFVSNTAFAISQAGTDDVYIGSRPDRPERTWLNNIAIYASALSAARVTAHYNARDIP